MPLQIEPSLPLPAPLSFELRHGSQGGGARGNQGFPRDQHRAHAAPGASLAPVRAVGVNVDWYARILRSTLHGDEVENIVVRIVPDRAVAASCGGGAASCYRGDRRGAVLVVPAGRGPRVAHLVVHEYAHHLDDRYDLTWAFRGDVPSWREGAVRWWTTRGMDSLLARGRVAFTYRLGWGRSIGEIFAEDFVRLHMRTRYRIAWLAPPAQRILTALRRGIRAAVSSNTF
jgi:hypothetical protein